jgi:hypothetical protein
MKKWTAEKRHNIPDMTNDEDVTAYLQLKNLPLQGDLLRW